MRHFSIYGTQARCPDSTHAGCHGGMRPAIAKPAVQVTKDQGNRNDDDNGRGRYDHRGSNYPGNGRVQGNRRRAAPSRCERTASGGCSRPGDRRRFRLGPARRASRPAPRDGRDQAGLATATVVGYRLGDRRRPDDRAGSHCRRRCPDGRGRPSDAGPAAETTAGRRPARPDCGHHQPRRPAQRLRTPGRAHT